MKKAVIVKDGIVARIVRADATDWEAHGVPGGCLLADGDADIEVGDYVSEKGKIDTLGRVKEPKKREITQTRYDKETGGLTVDGVTIATDRESQSLLTGAALAATRDSGYACQWKTPNGFVQLDAATIIKIADAVRAHVQCCFDKEAELLSEIDKAKTREAVEAIKWERE